MAKWIGRRIVPAVLAITVVLATMSVCFAQSKPFGDLKPYVPTEQQLQPSREEYLKQGLKNLDATPPVVSAQARRADASEAETLQFIRVHYAGTYEFFKEGGFARSSIEDITLDSSGRLVVRQTHEAVAPSLNFHSTLYHIFVFPLADLVPDARLTVEPRLCDAGCPSALLDTVATLIPIHLIASHLKRMTVPRTAPRQSPIAFNRIERREAGAVLVVMGKTGWVGYRTRSDYCSKSHQKVSLDYVQPSATSACNVA